MQVLNFPTYKFRIKSNENNHSIFDIIRKKYVILTPEEWVRQHFIHYLIQDKGYPISLIAVEKKLEINNLIKRTDILVFDTNGNPFLIVECKSPSITLSQNTFDQIARYNLALNAKYLVVTNGLKHLHCTISHKNERYVFLENIPDYAQI
jgi:hypothetical protein